MENSDGVNDFNSRFLQTRTQLRLLDEEEYKKHLHKNKGKECSSNYYSIPILTANNQKVYVSYQWREKDIELLDKIIKAYTDIFV